MNIETNMMTFDDLSFSVADSGVEENEVSGDTSKSGKSWPTETGEAARNAPSSKWGSRKKPQYHLKDGQNYSCKVAGAVAVANSDEASLVNHAQKELIYGLGRGGNLPFGAVKKLTDFYKDDNNQLPGPETEGRGNLGNSFGREGKEGRGKVKCFPCAAGQTICCLRERRKRKTQRKEGRRRKEQPLQKGPSHEEALLWVEWLLEAYASLLYLFLAKCSMPMLAPNG